MHAEPTRQPSQRGSTYALRYLAAALAFTTALLHLWQVPDQFISWPIRGIAFLLIAIAYGALAVNLLFAPRRLTLQLGIALNTLVLASWTFTRLIGIPTWITFTPQPITPINLTTTTIALTLIGLLSILHRQQRTPKDTLDTHPR